MSQTDPLRAAIQNAHATSEREAIQTLAKKYRPSEAATKRIQKRAEVLVKDIRAEGDVGLMEVFLAEYGLSTEEGVALMCLAEALLRVPDTFSIDELIEDKIAPSNWSEHLGQSSSHLVNASTWALMLTGQVLKEATGLTAILRSAVRRLGEPVIRTAVARAMKELGAQFVLGETIEQAQENGQPMQVKGYSYSFDMLGEAAMTSRDADGFFAAYASAIRSLGQASSASDIRDNPGISIKLSALHPRYERGQKHRVMDELVVRTRELARMAKSAGLGLNIDAEESWRLDVSLDVIAEVLADPKLSGWEGFGVVVQAYSKRAPEVIDWLAETARRLDRKIMVRLVKGAYWDAEIKRAQVEGLRRFPVYTRKSSTDISYIACAKKLLGYSGLIYPQFATHNAHSVAAILELAKDEPFEFQRLHGMGEALHERVRMQENTRCRIYAPVGPHRDLLAYLVRRLLENGANSSFVNQLLDQDVDPSDVVADPFDQPLERDDRIALPRDLFMPERTNSKGWDFGDAADEAAFLAARDPFEKTKWHGGPLIAGEAEGFDPKPVVNPADPKDHVGNSVWATNVDADKALAAAEKWTDPAASRARILNDAADLFEQNAAELYAILCREAGKTPADANAELREAVDFLRYYAARISDQSHGARGTVVCISPWNFPLAIFTGQIAAALAAGNAVVAKPAETTTLIATFAVKLMHQAGVPLAALQLLPGEGVSVGAKLCASPKVDAICFTGSTQTAKAIDRAMADNLAARAPLIAETGGLNAMIVDSTALAEQAVRDIIDGAFRSAGQRCSALRVLYVQEEMRDPLLKMLRGAMEELVVGNPWQMATDVGPVIDANAKRAITDHIEQARGEGRVLFELPAPSIGTFVGPTVINVQGIGAVGKEVFGPVLHVASYNAEQLDQIIDDTNATGYGLTFGIHSRIESRIEQAISRISAGNIYVNRNQIGAIVGSQPFGGEGLSGTGPKAGGPNYVARFCAPEHDHQATDAKFAPGSVSEAQLQEMIDQARAKASIESSLVTIDLPGPTGESNRLSTYGRGVVICLGPSSEQIRAQIAACEKAGCIPITFDGDAPIKGALNKVQGFAAVLCQSTDDSVRALRRELAARAGPIIPLLTETDYPTWLTHERHVCIDTTAAGGNASLLAEVGRAS